MAVSDLFNREIRANKSPRNAFSVGYSTIFSSPCGQLLPIYCQHVKRGDKLKLGVSSLTRTRPVNTAAYMSFDEKVDFWAVPEHLLWSDYESWLVGQTFRHRTTELSGVGSQNYRPFTRFSSIADYLKSFTSPPSQPLSRWFTSLPCTALRYLDMLNYSVPKIDGLMLDLKFDSVYKANDVSNVINKLVGYYDSISTIAPMNYSRLAAFQCIYMHSYRNEEYEVLDPSYYNCDNLFNNLVADNSVTNPSNPPTLSTPSYLVGVHSAETTSLDSRLSMAKLFTPRFKNWRKDVFTAVKPNAGFNVGNTGLEFGTTNYLSKDSSLYGSGFYWPHQNVSRPFPDAGANTDAQPDRYNPLEPVADSSDYDQTRRDWTFQIEGRNPANVVQRLMTVMNTGSTTKGLTFLYPQNIRNLMSQDKYSRAAIYADKDLSSQIKALFGENYEDPHKPRYLGSYSTNLSIDDVTASASGTADDPNGTSTSVLGELAGKVKSGESKDSVFERSFDHDCIVMGIHYIMPRNNYDSYRLDKWNTKISRWDYFNPHFDGLGLQPVLSYERSIDSVRDGITKASSLFGFAPRYYEYKQRTNEVHSSFMDAQPDYDWTLSNNGAVLASGDSPQNYKILPDITNRIFTVEYDGSPATDPFQHYYYFDATLVSDMEVYGTPSL